MARAPSAHPTPEQLSDFARGRLPEPQAATIADHLGNCPTCLGRVKAAAPASLAGRAPQAGPEDRAAAPPRAAGKDEVPSALQAQTKYRVVKLLGKGGMGAVYLAEHTFLNKRVALKVISPAVLDHPQALPRFREEVRNAARLEHPNIVRALDADQVGDLHLLVMEYVEGTDLDRVLRQAAAKGQPIPVAEACRWVRQAALGLQHAHEQGMVHRDIKPHNLMLTKDGRVKILDFGLAKLVGEAGRSQGLTGTGFMGTAEYVAPEQAADARTADIRADIYSLGCTLHAVLSGRPPFVEGTLVKTVLAHLGQAPPPLRGVRADVPAGLEAVVLKMLAKDPAGRYQTPAEVARALAPFAKGAASGASRLEAARPAKAPPLEGPGDEAKSPRGRTARGQVPALPAAPPWVAGLAGWVRSHWPLVAGAAGAGVLLVLLALALTLRTRHGTLVLEVDDPEATVQVLGAQGRVLVSRPAEPGVMTISVAPGKGQLRLEKGGVEVFAREFEVAPGGKTAPIKARWEPPVAAAADPVRPAPKPPAAGEVLENSIGMKLAYIPAGKFLMGSPPDEDQRSDDEGPVHEVVLTRPFWLGVYEVTQEQYEKVMASNPSWFSPDGGGRDAIKGMDTAHFPVENVSWEDAAEFCRRLGELPAEKAAGRVYRLPAEAEWEYACRAGASGSKPFSIGSEGTTSLSSRQANFNGTFPYGDAPEGRQLKRTVAVGRYEANRWGLYDLHGNVWEWCADWYDPDYYAGCPRENPPGPQQDSRRVCRGGSWSSFGLNCRSAYRRGFAPANRDDKLGFRVAVTAADSAPPVEARPGAVPAAGQVLENSVGMKLAYLPAGRFLMGSPPDEANRRWDNEGAVHEVVITRPFWLGVHEVTQEQYQKVMGKNPSCFSPTGSGRDAVQGLDTSRFPVENVSWEDAAEFCRRLSERPEEKAAGRVYRLPTEAEWEYACRTGASDSKPFYVGKEGTTALSSRYANFNGKFPYGNVAGGVDLQRPVPVGSYQANRWGLYDLHGNVWEWCADWYDPDYYAASPREDPPGPRRGSVRVIRGGGWDNAGHACRAANRHGPGDGPGFWNFNLGFRVAAGPPGR